MADKLTLDKHDMKDRTTAHLRIYVGGLTDDANVDALYNHFIEYGQIDGIILNRIFGFVQFHHESSAQEAIAKGNGSIFQGKKLTVKPTQKKRDVEVVPIQSDVPPAVALNDNMPVGDVDEPEDLYDSYGNYVGDTSNKEEDYEDGYNNKSWNERDSRVGMRGRPIRGRGRGRGGPGSFSDRTQGAYSERIPGGYSERSPGAFQDRPPASIRGPEWPDRKYERFAQPEYPRALPVPERNDCEIIVVSKSLTEYAEYIESRLKRLGIVVDLLFPMEDVPIGKVLGNIASRGCLYAILVMPQNQEHRSLTLTILHGLPQEHRDMPLEDSLQLLSRNFQEVQRGGSSGREAVYALLGQLADGRTLTVLQYDKVIEYLQEKREQQFKIELGGPSTTTTGNKTEVVLQQRILNILNDKKAVTKPEPGPTPAPQPALNKQEQLLNDPTVRKALDSILMKFT